MSQLSLSISVQYIDLALTIKCVFEKKHSELQLSNLPLNIPCEKETLVRLSDVCEGISCNTAGQSFAFTLNIVAVWRFTRGFPRVHFKDINSVSPVMSVIKY